MELRGVGSAPSRALRMRHPAHPRELRAIRRRVERWAAGIGMSENALVDLQIAVGEAVANGVEHAYRNRQPGTLEIDLDVCGGVVVVQVVDHGRWRAVPPVRGYRGHGLDVIERLGRHLHVLPMDTGTLVCFEVPLNGASG